MSDAASLRVAAMDALGSLGDVTAHEALESATIALELDVARWEGSVGIVRAHRVTLGLEAGLLARVVASPAAQDALHAAIASAVARAPREALSELRFAWRAHGGETTSPYRGHAPATERPAVTANEAMATYLRALGEDEAAVIARDAEIATSERRGHRVITLRIPPEHEASLGASPAIGLALAAAARALHAGRADEAPEVRLSYAR